MQGSDVDWMLHLFVPALAPRSMLPPFSGGNARGRGEEELAEEREHVLRIRTCTSKKLRAVTIVVWKKKGSWRCDDDDDSVLWTVVIPVAMSRSVSSQNVSGR